MNLNAMAKGVSIKFKSYAESVPNVLRLVKLEQEIKKHSRIVLKPYVSLESGKSTDAGFLEEVVKFCISNKAEGSEIVIADGLDGGDTTEMFDTLGYTRIAEQKGISIVDLNKAECESVSTNDFVSFGNIMYPSILRSSFVVSMPSLQADEKMQLTGSLASMIGAFPARHYKGIFSSRKSKLDDVSMKNKIHDIIMCKMPDLAVIDAKGKGMLVVGQPLEMDKQAAKMLGMDWRNVAHLRMIEDSLNARAKPEPVMPRLES